MEGLRGHAASPCPPAREVALVLGRDAHAVARGAARGAPIVLSRVARAVAREAALVLGRDAHAVARGAARGAPIVLSRGARAVARGASHGAPIVLSRGAQANARGGAYKSPISLSRSAQAFARAPLRRGLRHGHHDQVRARQIQKWITLGYEPVA